MFMSRLTHVVAVHFSYEDDEACQVWCLMIDFAGIKDDHHVADILGVSETAARLIAVCYHAAWLNELLSLASLHVLKFVTSALFLRRYIAT
jgi:hypothetical protein